MKRILPGEVSGAELHQYLLGAIAPRPIAFASTIDKNGKVNLAPFSFFNCFGSNPPIIVFSPARSGRSGNTKHTLDNIKDTGECVINAVNYAMVNQMNIASTEYDKGINEFVKSGFTEIPSTIVKPPRVKESPAQLECVVKQIIETGEKGGAGNLIIAEVVCMHLDESILDENGKISPQKIDLVARMGGSWYVRAQGSNLFKLPQPIGKIPLGFDALPNTAKNSHSFTGNELAQMATLDKMPSEEKMNAIRQMENVRAIMSSNSTAEIQNNLFGEAKQYIAQSMPEEALALCLIAENL